MVGQEIAPRGLPAAERALSSARSWAHELLSFRLGGEEYAVNLLSVQEIRSFQPPTRIAGAPAHMLGVLNLRGTIVPVIDLRRAIGLDQATFDAFTVVVVFNVQARVFGAVVDAVCDVVEVNSSQMRDIPPMHGAGAEDMTCGLAIVDTRTLVLIDAHRLTRQLLDAPVVALPEGPPIDA